MWRTWSNGGGETGLRFDDSVVQKKLAPGLVDSEKVEFAKLGVTCLQFQRQLGWMSRNVRDASIFVTIKVLLQLCVFFCHSIRLHELAKYGGCGNCSEDMCTALMLQAGG